MRSNRKTDQTVKGLGKFAFPSESKGKQTQKKRSILEIMGMESPSMSLLITQGINRVGSQGVSD